MTMVALATLLLMALAIDGSMGQGTREGFLNGIAKSGKATAEMTPEHCKALKPFPESILTLRNNRCHVTGGYFQFDEDFVQDAKTAEKCQAVCASKKYKHCHNWRFETGTSGCYVQVGSCANDAKFKEMSISGAEKIKSGAWISGTNQKGNVAGPHQCIRPIACYHHGVWYDGNAVGEIQNFAKMEECEEQCENTENCNFFIYVTNGAVSDVSEMQQLEPGNCFMKSALVGSPSLVPGLVVGRKCCLECSPMISILKREKEKTARNHLRKVRGRNRRSIMAGKH